MSNRSRPTLLCYDGSASARRALTVAATTLARHGGVVLYVWRQPLEALTDSFSDPSGSGGPSLATLQRSVFNRATEIVEEGQRLASQLGWDVETQVEPANDGVGRTIARVADLLDAELVVLGTHGATAAQAGLLGSVSRDVLESSTRPVLVVPKML